MKQNYKILCSEGGQWVEEEEGKRGREQEAKTGKLKPVFTVRMRIIDHDKNLYQDQDQEQGHE